MQGISEWLVSLGLGEYADRFAENAIDLSVIRDLTEQDLTELGVLLGHRRKILRAIAGLNDAAYSAPQTVEEPTRQDEAERRHVSVMFCDLVGSTALSARLDPEDVRAVIASYLSCLAEVITQHQGIIARYMGDGVLAYFGYPRAHEDDAEQAVRAGLALVDAVAKLKADSDAPLQVRVGVATGTVVVGDRIGEGAAKEQAVVGEAPNLAARLQSLAEPGTVMICASTRQLAGGYFEYRDLGPLALKGFTTPVPASVVLGTTGVESRFAAQHMTRLTPLLGRDDEIELLLRRWRQAAQGEGRVVVLTGEPGIGNRTWPLRLRSGSNPNRTPGCTTFARHIIPTAHCFRSSGILNGPPDSSAGTYLRRNSTNLKPFLRHPPPTRVTRYRLSPTFCPSRRMIATPCPTSVRNSARRKR
jgi:class 3 adenylate cyclase